MLHVPKCEPSTIVLLFVLCQLPFSEVDAQGLTGRLGVYCMSNHSDVLLPPQTFSRMAVACAEQIAERTMRRGLKVQGSQKNSLDCMAGLDSHHFEGVSVFDQHELSITGAETGVANPEYPQNHHDAICGMRAMWSATSGYCSSAEGPSKPSVQWMFLVSRTKHILTLNLAVSYMPCLCTITV